ncbi:hypothetical protein AX17_005201 [Amanita inopinata Kibby_2008]|nr:hypothetical protein AX17_005201 [Amanita inopinata Kibby_2008]
MLGSGSTARQAGKVTVSSLEGVGVGMDMDLVRPHKRPRNSSNSNAGNSTGTDRPFTQNAFVVRGGGGGGVEGGENQQQQQQQQRNGGGAGGGGGGGGSHLQQERGGKDARLNLKQVSSGGGAQQQQQQTAATTTSSGAAKGRAEDKNRKLSCKECRRRVFSGRLTASFYHHPYLPLPPPPPPLIILTLCRSTRLKLKARIPFFPSLQKPSFRTPLPLSCFFQCDRVFPCQSCVKRGCSSLCPEGALTSGRGSRFILANTEQLHEKIFQLSDRVRQLEDALETLQSSSSSQSHPLLAPELRSIKTSQDLYTTPHSQVRQQQASQSDQSNGDGQKDDRLRQSVVELSLNKLATNNSKSNAGNNAGVMPQIDSNVPSRSQSAPPEVPPDILQLSTTFPFPWSVDLKIRKRIRDSLPPRADAQATCEEARRNALWQYNLDASETFLPNLLHYCYTTPVEHLSPRRLALLLMVLSIGSLVDLNKPLGNLYGEAYHHLARASVCEIPLMEEPDFDVLHALFFMIWYHLIFSDNKKAVGYAWNLMGFVAKLAQGLGLHRDGSRLKRIPEEFERRRTVFWELLNMDCRMSLSLGRPPSICLAHVDVKPPSYIGPGLYVPREEIVYHEWKNSFFINCLTPILEAMIAVNPPHYSRILNLDVRVRDFDVPKLLDDNNSQVAPRFLNMQRALFSMGRDLALLQLHRRYFMEAMNGPEPFDLHHQYSPSVLATCLGASSLIATVQTLFDREPDLSARFLHFWFNAFSAAVTLALFISRAPSTPLAPYALQDLETLSRLFLRAGKILPFSAKALPVIEKLADKSRRNYLQHQSNNPYDEQPLDLLPSFQNVHPSLVQFAEQIKYTSPARLSSFNGAHNPEPNPSSEAWLPDIYQFSSAGMDVEERYTFASAQPTPFIPSSPRVAENETFNFDHGALTVDLEETSYMAWF